MSTLNEQFEQAVADSKNLSERPDNMTMLKLYALYKQGSTGDVDGKRPDRKSTRLNSSHFQVSRMPSSA